MVAQLKPVLYVCIFSKTASSNHSLIFGANVTHKNYFGCNLVNEENVNLLEIWSKVMEISQHCFAVDAAVAVTPTNSVVVM